MYVTNTIFWYEMSFLRYIRLLTCQYRWVSLVFTLMSTPVTRKKTYHYAEYFTGKTGRYQNVGMQSTIKYTISKQFVSIMSKNCLCSFRCNKKIVVIHLTLIQTSKGQNNFVSLNLSPNVIPIEKSLQHMFN